MRFQKGNKMAPGGRRPGFGNKAGWFRSWCAEAVSNESRLKRLADILDHGPFDEFWEVFKYCAEIGHVAIKPPQSLALMGEITQRKIIINPPKELLEYHPNGNGHAIESSGTNGKQL